MKAIKKLCWLLSIVVLGLTSIHASNISIVTSLLNSGDLAGGLRYSLSNNWAIDGWMSQRENSAGTQVGQFWVDCFYKNYGVVISGEEKKAFKYAAAYAVERSITEKISLGVLVKAIEVSETKPSYLGSWDSYIVLSI